MSVRAARLITPPKWNAHCSQSSNRLFTRHSGTGPFSRNVRHNGFTSSRASSTKNASKSFAPKLVVCSFAQRRANSHVAAQEIEDIATVQLSNASAIPVTLPNGSTRPFSALLLRDLCKCPRCVNPSTKQKLFSTIEIPSSISPSSVKQQGSQLSIAWDNDIARWPEDHITEIDLTLLQRMATTGTTTKPRPKSRSFWTAADFEQNVVDFDYKSYVEDDRTLHAVLQQLYKYGLVFIKDVPESEKSVSQLAERIAPIKNTFYGFTWDVRSVPQAINVAYTSGDLGFHMDLMYMHQPPYLQLLHCIRASSAGGASMFTDSFRAAKDLLQEDRGAFDTLASVPVHFHYDHPGSQYYHQARHVFELRDRSKQSQSNLHQPYDSSAPLEEIQAVTWAPQFQAPFTGRPYWGEGDDDVIGDRLHEWHVAAGKFNALIEKEDGIYERMMGPGLCVIFDNRRVLHARRAFAEGDVGKERWLRGTYIDEDPYLAKMRVLEDKFA